MLILPSFTIPTGYRVRNTPTACISAKISVIHEQDISLEGKSEIVKRKKCGYKEEREGGLAKRRRG
jgi:hypothetical protein